MPLTIHEIMVPLTIWSLSLSFMVSRTIHERDDVYVCVCVYVYMKEVMCMCVCVYMCI